MAIKGHKERALLRRGYGIQEALKRRSVLNETAFLRRNLLTEEKEVEDDIDKLHHLCGEEVSEGVTNGIYCELVGILDSLQELPRQETYNAIKDIYNFFKPEKKDNRTLFKKTIQAVLKNENPSNALNLISKFLRDPEFDKDGIKRALYDFRHSDGDIPQDVLEDFLKRARFKEYTKYENSFAGNNFDVVRGSIKFSHGYEDTFWKVVLGVSTKKYDIDTVVKTVAQTILTTDITKLINKADLTVKNDLMVGDKVIVPKGGKIEVKKLDYELDSYFSEFFAIYKNKLPDIAYTDEFIETYNEIIDGVYTIVKEKGQHLIDAIVNGFSAIMYDGNLLVMKDDIQLYWSNKGQRGCNEHRLSIRYRLVKPEIMAYIYNSKTHSNQLIPQEISVDVKPEVVC